VGELRISTAPPRRELLDLLGARLGNMVPGWQTLAEDLLGSDATIDLLGSDSSGRTVAVLIGEAGEDLELIGRGLAQRAWIVPRVRDWLQLAPSLPLRPEAGVLAVLLCPSFRPEAWPWARFGTCATVPASSRCSNESTPATRSSAPRLPRAPPRRRPSAPASPTKIST